MFAFRSNSWLDLSPRSDGGKGKSVVEGGDLTKREPKFLFSFHSSSIRATITLTWLNSLIKSAVLMFSDWIEHD